MNKIFEIFVILYYINFFFTLTLMIPTKLVEVDCRFAEYRLVEGEGFKCWNESFDVSDNFFGNFFFNLLFFIGLSLALIGCIRVIVLIVYMLGFDL